MKNTTACLGFSSFFLRLILVLHSRILQLAIFLRLCRSFRLKLFSFSFISTRSCFTFFHFIFSLLFGNTRLNPQEMMRTYRFFYWYRDRSFELTNHSDTTVNFPYFDGNGVQGIYTRRALENIAATTMACRIPILFFSPEIWFLFYYMNSRQ